MTTSTSSDAGVASAAPAVAALEYCARGWRVLPLRGKIPFAGTHGVDDASSDPAVALTWPEGANVGIATGGDLLVLDVDDPDSLHELERRHGALPHTASVVTGNGGSHFYFQTSRTLGCSVATLGDGLDTRGAGGYVVAPPSIHPGTGRLYEWDEHPSHTPPAPLPGWLEHALSATRIGSALPISHWRELSRAGIGEGRRNQCTAQLAGHLLARGVDPFVTLELLVGWDRGNRPPLGRDEVTRVVDSIARKEARKWAAA